MRRRIAALLALVLVAGAAAWVVVWSPLFDSPERHVARYLDATSFGDSSRAWNEWALYQGSANVPRDPIATRRRDLTIELSTNRVGRDYTITRIDYWRTCCEPGLVDGPSAAGLARVHVTTAGGDGRTRLLVFEVWVKDLTWWGAAAGESIHDWRLYEVHAEDEACVFPNPASGCIHSFG